MTGSPVPLPPSETAMTGSPVPLSPSEFCERCGLQHQHRRGLRHPVFLSIRQSTEQRRPRHLQPENLLGIRAWKKVNMQADFVSIDKKTSRGRTAGKSLSIQEMCHEMGCFVPQSALCALCNIPTIIIWNISSLVGGRYVSLSHSSLLQHISLVQL